jgi:hypothetical protein
MLPWTEVIFCGTSASGQRAVSIGPGNVCSKDANGCSGRGIGDPVFAVKPVGRRRDAGSVGGPANGIGPPRMAGNTGRRRIGVIGNGGVNAAKRRQLTRNHRARASAYPRQAKIFRLGGAIDRVATPFFPFPMNSPASAFVAWHAAWLCVASWIGKHAIWRGVGVGAVSA